MHLYLLLQCNLSSLAWLCFFLVFLYIPAILRLNLLEASIALYFMILGPFLTNQLYLLLNSISWHLISLKRTHFLLMWNYLYRMHRPYVYYLLEPRLCWKFLRVRLFPSVRLPFCNVFFLSIGSLLILSFWVKLGLILRKIFFILKMKIWHFWAQN